MPSVFISYAHADTKFAVELENALKLTTVTIWRDKASLHTGEKWPKALGEAIASADAVALLWSSTAAASEFVELEWNIALALKIPILPCLLDATPLPPSLRALHADSERDARLLAARVSEALACTGTSKDEAIAQPVIDRLAAIRDQEPKRVLQAAKAVFAQQGWVVQGPVYQAARDIHIHGEKTRKSLGERWQVWVAIVVGVLTAVTLGKQLTGRPSLQDAQQTVGEHAGQSTPTKQRLAGIISEEDKGPVPGAEVSLPDFDQTQRTDENGHYSFVVSASEQEQVTLIARKGGYDTYQGYATLGNTSMNFSLRRKR